MTAAGWLADFPILAELPPNEIAPLVRAAVPIQLPAGTTVFSPGQECVHFIMVRQGVVRAYQIAEDGTEIVLYRMGRGGACILTTITLLGSEAYAAYAVTETPVVAVGVPAAVFHEMMAQSAGFRRYIFTSHAERMADLMRVIQLVAFETIDTRLAARLLALAAPNTRLAITHQQLAAEIGTAREVVSRHLKAFERRGWVALGRGTVALLRPDSLRSVATGPAM